jgi:flagellar motility protein MotE (MotC chaperone)
MSDEVGDGALQVNYVNGYASLSAFIASDSDKSTAIYRRFDRLSARNLLYLQSELEELQDLQDQYDAEDRRATTEKKAVIRNLTLLKQRAKIGDDNARKRLELIREIAEKMKEYRQYIVRC